MIIIMSDYDNLELRWLFIYLLYHVFMSIVHVLPSAVLEEAPAFCWL